MLSAEADIGGLFCGVKFYAHLCPAVGNIVLRQLKRKLCTVLYICIDGIEPAVGQRNAESLSENPYTGFGFALAACRKIPYSALNV